jgi:DNA (cytosine-5)-methyltransferase 1
MKKDSLKAISLFTGVGGLDFGFEAAGFQTAVALEMDSVACRTIRLNRTWKIIEGDIAKIPSSSILAAGGLKERDADILIGGPPCQPFSKSGYWATGDASRLDDPRAQTLKHYLRVLRETLPRTFLLENVLGFSYLGKSEGLDFIRRGIARINSGAGTNYSIHVQALNAADFGVPQMRERVFVVGSREGLPFDFPTPTHGAKNSASTSMLPFATAWDAIGDFAETPCGPDLTLRGKWADLLPSIPEGSNYLWHTSRGRGQPLFGWRTRYWNFLLKLAKDQPSWTIQAQPGPATGPFHWSNRRLSAKELSRLQTFPDDLIFPYGLGDAQRLIGNAVPSALAELVAREIKMQLLRGRTNRQQLTLLPAKREDVPPAERPSSVPRKYLTLLGEHAEHPGTGKGVGALRRARDAA